MSFITQNTQFDYNMRNIATDLRDGVRLARLVELLTHTKDLSSALRVPAVSRLQKLHNVGLVLKKLNECIATNDPGYYCLYDSHHCAHTLTLNFILFLSRMYSAQTDSIDPKCIVDGHREKTLLLLWRMLYGFELRMLIDPDRVAKEVHEIYKNKAWRRYDQTFIETIPTHTH